MIAWLSPAANYVPTGVTAMVISRGSPRGMSGVRRVSASCSGVQSNIDPAGERGDDAARIDSRPRRTAGWSGVNGPRSRLRRIVRRSCGVTMLVGDCARSSRHSDAAVRGSTTAHAARIAYGLGAAQGRGRSARPRSRSAAPRLAEREVLDGPSYRSSPAMIDCMAVAPPSPNAVVWHVCRAGRLYPCMSPRAHTGRSVGDRALSGRRPHRSRRIVCVPRQSVDEVADAVGLCASGPSPTGGFAGLHRVEMRSPRSTRMCSRRRLGET